MIMGYDYYWSGSANAGSVAPLEGGNYNVNKSVHTFLQDIPKEKLTLGVPYYGYEWPTQDDTRLSATTGQGTALTYVKMRDAASLYGRKWDGTWKTPWYAYQSSGQWYQGHYDDNESLAYKYDLVLATDIAGIGIWALGYDPGATELWDLIRSKFADLTLPTVAFIAPTNGSTVNKSVEVNVTASDKVGIDFVELYIDGNYMATLHLPPYSYTWDTTKYADGDHDLRARAYDRVWNIADASIKVKVKNVKPDITPPTVAILSPADNATVAKNVSIIIEAKDDVALGNVSLWLDGSFIETWTDGTHTYPWKNPPIGNHTIKADAWDTSFNHDSMTIHVAVKNATPSQKTVPMVIYSSPLNVTGVDVNVTVIMVFSETMDRTGTESAFSILPKVNGTFTWHGPVMEFKPSKLTRATQYDISISGTARSSAGVPMNHTHAFWFKTENATPPKNQTTNATEEPPAWVRTVSSPYVMFPAGIVAGLLVAFIIIDMFRKRKRPQQPMEPQFTET
jgi:hypothetical protein